MSQEVAEVYPRLGCQLCLARLGGVRKLGELR